MYASEFVPLLVPTVIFASVVLIVYIIYTTRNRERMAMIEKGVDPSLFHEESKRKSVSSLKPALFLIGIGFGFLFGYLLDDWGVVSEEASFISMIILFGGLGLLLYYFIEGKKLQEDNRSE